MIILHKKRKDSRFKKTCCYHFMIFILKKVDDQVTVNLRELSIDCVYLTGDIISLGVM